MKKHTLFSLVLLVILFAGVGCNPLNPEDLGPSNNQQIFGEWKLGEILRSRCFDADNNYRRSCEDCHILTLNTEYSFQITNDKDELLSQGTFRVLNETDILFDPGIFTTESVSKARYSLITGAMKFEYTDPMTLCEVTEVYVVNSKNVAGD
jgi:hypothetical protein